MRPYLVYCLLVGRDPAGNWPLVSWSREDGDKNWNRLGAYFYLRRWYLLALRIMIGPGVLTFRFSFPYWGWVNRPKADMTGRTFDEDVAAWRRRSRLDP